jgi:predicted RNA-binding Zn ribbon-like protein
MQHMCTDMPEDRAGFRFRGDHIALDLTATLTGRLKDKQTELLAAREDLDRWLVSSGLAAKRPGATAEEVELAHILREAIYALVTGTGSKTARVRLNAIAAMSAAAPQLSTSGQVVRAGNAAGLLASIARDAVELLGSSDASRIRQCEGDGCAILYLDLSRSRARRWCSMVACGNRAKARAFRTRNLGSGV